MVRNRKARKGHEKLSSTASQRTRNATPVSHAIQTSGLRGQSRVSHVQTPPVTNAPTRKSQTKVSSTAHQRTRNTALASPASQTTGLRGQPWLMLSRYPQHAGVNQL